MRVIAENLQKAEEITAKHTFDFVTLSDAGVELGRHVMEIFSNRISEAARTDLESAVLGCTWCRALAHFSMTGRVRVWGSEGHLSLLWQALGYEALPRPTKFLGAEPYTTPEEVFKHAKELYAQRGLVSRSSDTLEVVMAVPCDPFWCLPDELPATRYSVEQLFNHEVFDPEWCKSRPDRCEASLKEVAESLRRGLKDHRLGARHDVYTVPVTAEFTPEVREQIKTELEHFRRKGNATPIVPIGMDAVYVGWDFAEKRDRVVATIQGVPPQGVESDIVAKFLPGSVELKSTIDRVVANNVGSPGEAKPYTLVRWHCHHCKRAVHAYTTEADAIYSDEKVNWGYKIGALCPSGHLTHARLRELDTLQIVHDHQTGEELDRGWFMLVAMLSHSRKNLPRFNFEASADTLYGAPCFDLRLMGAQPIERVVTRSLASRCSKCNKWTEGKLTFSANVPYDSLIHTKCCHCDHMERKNWISEVMKHSCGRSISVPRNVRDVLLRTQGAVHCTCMGNVQGLESVMPYDLSHRKGTKDFAISPVLR
jgi:hypothetical protein